MFFNAQAALAKLRSQPRPPATSATPATCAAQDRPQCRNVADVAGPHLSHLKIPAPSVSHPWRSNTAAVAFVIRRLGRAQNRTDLDATWGNMGADVVADPWAQALYRDRQNVIKLLEGLAS